MKIVLKVMAVIFGLGFLGQLVAGKMFFAGLILAIICGYFGWRESNQKSENNNNNNTIN